MNFYSVIIGTELLNGRRKDAHFEFLNKELLKRGWEQKGSFVIKDEPPFMSDIYNLIKNDPDSVMFSFGGIGATPDDYTRQVAGDVFRDGKMEVNEIAKQTILDTFGSDAYPHRINMATLPVNASLLKNVVSNVPGFYLDDRFFFTPGFPSMSQHMIIEALDKLYPQNKPKYRLTLTAFCSENDLVNTMKELSPDVDLSSLPVIKDDIRHTVISISSFDKLKTTEEFNKFINYCKRLNIKYTLKDINK